MLVPDVGPDHTHWPMPANLAHCSVCCLLQLTLQSVHAVQVSIVAYQTCAQQLQLNCLAYMYQTAGIAYIILYTKVFMYPFM